MSQETQVERRAKLKEIASKDKHLLGEIRRGLEDERKHGVIPLRRFDQRLSKKRQKNK